MRGGERDNNSTIQQHQNGGSLLTPRVYLALPGTKTHKKKKMPSSPTFFFFFFLLFSSHLIHVVVAVVVAWTATKQ
jgi:hypothetical protein